MSIESTSLSKSATSGPEQQGPVRVRKLPDNLAQMWCDEAPQDPSRAKFDRQLQPTLAVVMVSLRLVTYVWLDLELAVRTL